jgi:hypothetical protein
MCHMSKSNSSKERLIEITSYIRPSGEYAERYTSEKLKIHPREVTGLGTSSEDVEMWVAGPRVGPDQTIKV